MAEILQKRFAMLAADTPNIDSSQAAGEFIFAGPVLITKVGLTVTTAVVTDNSADCDLILSRRPVAGSSSNEVALGIFKAIAAGVDPAAGSVQWAHTNVIDTDGEQPEDYDADTSRAWRNEAPNSNITAAETGENPWVILPGQSFAMTLESGAEGDSGAVRGWVEYIELPYNSKYIDQTNVTQRTVVAS